MRVFCSKTHWLTLPLLFPVVLISSRVPAENTQKGLEPPSVSVSGLQWKWAWTAWNRNGGEDKDHNRPLQMGTRWASLYFHCQWLCAEQEFRSNGFWARNPSEIVMLDYQWSQYGCLFWRERESLNRKMTKGGKQHQSWNSTRHMKWKRNLYQSFSLHLTNEIAFFFIKAQRSFNNSQLHLSFESKWQWMEFLNEQLTSAAY